VSRAPLVAQDTDDAQAAALLDEVARMHGFVPNLHRTLAHAPAMLRGWLDFGVPLRAAPRTPRALRELIIMRSAQVSGAAYEWAHHWPMAIENGVPERKLLALANWSADDSFAEHERAALEFAEQVLASGVVTESTYARLRQHFDVPEVIEITLTASFYANVARVLLALRVEVEPEYEIYLGNWT
jgi:alkylhydroperoxidase family enzyme